MTTWEHRGYLAYPGHCGKPQPGTDPELAYCRGWAKAQKEDMENQKSDYHLSLESEALLGRDTYAVQYWNENKLEF